MILKTERLTLRPFTMGDLKTTHAYASDPENTRFMIHLPNKTKRQTRRFLKYTIAKGKKRPQRCYEFTVILDGKHIGAVSVNLDKSGQEGELGWIIQRAYWGNGYATEAAGAIMTFAREELQVKKLVAHCDHRNSASARVMEKLGMALESDSGTRRYKGSEEDVRELKYAVSL